MTVEINLDRIKKWKNALRPEEIDWLIEQAERVQEWEEHCEENHEIYTSNLSILEKENVRLREVLKFYADEENYSRSVDDLQTGYPPEVIQEGGYTARQALKGESE